MKVKINRARCKECGLCIHNCPKKCISKSTELNDAGYYPVQIDDEACIGCGICPQKCPRKLITVDGKVLESGHEVYDYAIEPNN